MEQQISNGGLQYIPQIEEQYTALDSNEALINRNSTINSTGHSAEINTITVSAEENTTAGSAAFSIFAVSQTENAFIAGFDDLTWDTFSEGYDGYYFQHEDIIDAEKCTSITQDDMMCWAATASNMLYYTEWLLQDTTNEDEIFTVFVDNFREGKRYGGNAYYAVQWYFTGSYTPSGWSEWDKPYANTGDYFDNITLSSYLSSKNATTSNFTLAVDKLQDGYAVGLSFGYYNTAGERTGGHAITLWGMTYDTSLSVTDPNYYTGIIVTDSDDDKGYYGDPLAAPDTLKIISITYDSSKKQYILDPDYAGNNCIVETLHFLAPNPGFTPNAEPVDSAVKIYNSSEVVSRTKSVADKTLASSGEHLMRISSGGTADNTTINAGGSLYISSAGRANQTTVNSGGRMYISSGGVADSTMVNSGGRVYISSGGVANSTTGNSGGYMYIFSGGVANDTTINSGGWMYISSGGVANDTTINTSGRMYIFSGGVANDTTINSGGYMYISSGGVANDTTVNSGCDMYISSGGVANSTTVNSLGAIHISSGGVTNSTTLKGSSYSSGNRIYYVYGYMYISSGGTANSTTVNPHGLMFISSGGVANRTTVNDWGRMYISSGGTANSTTVNSSGSMNISSGGMASSTTVDNGGSMTVFHSGTASNTTVNKKGSVVVSSGGVMSSATVCGGIRVSSGGIVNDAVIDAYGSLTIYNGSLHNAIVNSYGFLYVSGGILNDITVNSGGSMRISGYGGSAATASNTTVNSGGRVSAMQKAVLSNTVINAGGSAELLYSGSAYDTTISSGGVMTAYYYKATALLHNVNVSSGGMLYFGSGTAAYNNGVQVTGTLNLAGTLFVTEKSVDMSEATVNLILADRSAEDDYIINGFDRMTSPTYTITVSADQEYGTYKLAQGAENFTGSISVGDGSVNFGSVAVDGKDLIHAQKRYSLDRANGKLTLSVSEADTTPPELTVSCNPTGWTNKSVTLTVSANEDCSIQYQVNNGSWIGYSAGGISISSNCGINFKATDLQGNITEKSFSVGNIDTKAPVVSEENLQGVVDGSSVTYDFTDIFSDDLSGIQKYVVQWISGKDLSLIREFSTTSSVYSTGAIEDGKYYLDVTAIDNAGNKSTKKKAHAVVIDTAPPTVPQNVVVTNSKNSVTVTWSPSTDAGIGLQKYVLQISSDVSFSNIVQTQEISYKTSYALTLNDGKYYFRVKAVDYQGKASNWSQSATVIIDSAAPEAPVAKADITSATNLNVTVTATFSADSTVKEFSLNNKDWNTYSSAVIMTANGTVYFRGKDEAGNYSPVTSYEVNNIDKVAPNKPTANADITTVTNQNVTVTATFSADSTVKEFSLNNKDWNTYSSAVIMTANGTVYFRGKDKAGNYSAVTSYSVNNIDKVAPEAPVAKADITSVTNQNVTVTATFSADSTVKEFSLNNQNWQTYTAGVVMSDNGTVYFRGKDEAGNYSPVTSYEVNNIDKVAPEAPVANADITSVTNQNVTVTATFSSDSVEKEFSLNNKDWKTYTAGVVFEENGTVYFRGKDEAGNYSPVTSYSVNNIDKVAPEAPVAKADITKVTNQNVTVTATFSSDSTVKEFSLNNKDWQTYTEGIVFEENGTVYFRGKDAAGNCSPVTSYSVNNIDKIAPDKPVAKADITSATNQNVTVTAAFSADSTVKEFSLNNKDWNTYSSAVVMTANGTVYFRGKDEAGNYSPVTSYSVNNIDKVAPEVPASFTGSVSNYSAKLDWSDAVDGGISGIKGYFFRYGTSKTLSGNSSFVSESGKTLSNLAVGTWYYQVKAVDNAGNTSAWSAIQTFSVAPGKVQDLQGNANGLSWEPIAGVKEYTVECSKDNFNHFITIETQTANIDLFALPSGSYQVRVKAEGGSYSDSKNISVNASAQAQVFSSDSDGNTDVFFASGNTVWGNGYAARHQGVLNRWLGTETQIMLAGKSRLDDVFCGSNDANVLVMTDDINGDALFLDDIYTSLGNQARLSQIDEIRAGFGDDVVDLTSQRYACSGNGLTIYGGSGNDTIWGNCGSNTLFGDSGSDNLIGGSDNDILIGGSGNDSMHGGGGDDIFCFGGNWGTDTIEQLADGKVTLWFENGSASKWNASTLTYTDGANSVSVSGTTQITLKFGNNSALPAGAFADAASEKIFEDKNKGMLA